ncbi:MAG: hypothetical protein EPO02_07155 [Nitrospirae bacterium]|nr:MAG: hypothetical protein EPO02_07155 [Nitrospirota bacterium]
MRNPPSAENAASPAARPELGAVLFIAGAVVFVGTLLVDPARLWLLTVPASFLLAAFAAGALVDRATGWLPHAGGPFTAHRLAVHLGTGLACLAVLAVWSALGGVFRVAGLAVSVLCAYGLFLAICATARYRPTGGIFAAAVGGLVMGVTLLVAWLWATIPPTFFDELEYHLVIPQRALATGELQTAPWVFFTLMPHASDLLLAWGMALGGDLGARAIVFALWVVCVLGAWGLAEAIAGSEHAAPSWAAGLVVAALAASPMLWFLATLPFAETGLAVSILIAAAILVSCRGEPRPWLALGLVLGLAVSVKLAGLYWVAGALVAALVAGWPARAVFRSMLIVLAMLAPWWARAYAHTGNPVYPLAYGLLGGSPWSEESEAKVRGALPYGTGGLGWTDVLRLPMDLVQYPERFGSASDAGALAVAAACLVLLLPVMAWVFGSDAERRRLSMAGSLFVLMTGACWVAVSPTTRFFAPALVMGLAVLVGLVLRVGPKGRALAMILLLPMGVWGTMRFIDQHEAVFSSYEVAMGREAADHYLARRLDHFQAARFAREDLPTTARVLFIGETRPYYFMRESMAPTAYDRHPLQRWVRESSSPETLARRLADEGFTHMVLNVREFKRLHDTYGVLVFSGEGAETHDRRLRTLPRTLRQLFGSNGVYVFEIPKL